MNSELVEILLVEDNPFDVDLTLHALRQNRVANHISVVSDGEEALDFLFRRGAFAGRPEGMPRLVLLDLKLPKVDGIGVLRALRADARTRMIPVVILTSSKEERDLVESYEIGVNSYIQKPVDFDQFREVVHQIGLYWLVTNQTPQLGAVAAANRKMAQ
jgi:two-component system, response regulator